MTRLATFIKSKKTKRQRRDVNYKPEDTKDWCNYIEERLNIKPTFQNRGSGTVK